MTCVSIIGNNSFIGRNLFTYLSAKGHIVSSFSSHLSQFYSSFLAQSISNCDYLIIVGWPMNDNTSDTYFLNWSRNICSLITSFLSISHVKRVIILGSCLEAGTSDDVLISEKTPFIGLSQYGLRKAQFYQYLCSSYGNQNQITWIRLFGPTGQLENANRLFPSLTCDAITSNPIQLLYPSTLRDFYTVDYLSEYFYRIIDSKFFGIINVGTGIAASVYSIAEAIIFENSSSSPVNCSSISSLKSNPYKSVSRVADTSILIRELGYIKPFSIHEIACLHRKIYHESQTLSPLH